MREARKIGRVLVDIYEDSSIKVGSICYNNDGTHESKFEGKCDLVAERGEFLTTLSRPVLDLIREMKKHQTGPIEGAEKKTESGVEQETTILARGEQ